jgi:hypothetical protein
MAHSFRRSIGADRNPIVVLLDHKFAAAAIMMAMVWLLCWLEIGSSPSTFSADCQALDQFASANATRLSGDTSASAEDGLADASFRLKRARNHCHNGWFTPARQDYVALIAGRYNEQR